MLRLRPRALVVLSQGSKQCLYFLDPIVITEYQEPILLLIFLTNLLMTLYIRHTIVRLMDNIVKYIWPNSPTKIGVPWVCNSEKCCKSGDGFVM